MANKLKSTIQLPTFLGGSGITEGIIFLVAFLLYSNTLGHNFTQDDAIVIYDNIYVKEGIDGLTKIFTTDSFSGFFKGEDKSSLVSGGRYRPMTIAVFAVMYDLVGDATFFYHLLIVSMYGVLCVLFFYLIQLLKFDWPLQQKKYLAFLASLIFTIHPIHTEVVANVKGLDEIFSLMFSLITMVLAIRLKSGHRLLFGGLLSLSFFIALLSKENAAPFVVIIPLVLYYFNKTSDKKDIILAFMILATTFYGYWLLRSSIVGASIGEPPSEMMNNPFIKVENGQYLPFSANEKWASIIYGMGKYIQLLFFPHPLTHDYYPRQFGVVSFQSLAVWASLAMNLALVLIAIVGIKKRSFISFCIFLFYATIALMSNVLFPIGTHLSERFLFTPSIAIALAGAFGIVQFRKYRIRESFLWVFLIFLVSIGSLKTIFRNKVWKDDLTLFTTDVKVSKNSAKIQNAAGGALLTASLQEEDLFVKESMIKKSIEHLLEAIRIHPNYKEAYLLSGNAYSYLKDYDASIASYEMAIRLNPNYDLAIDNLLIVLKEGARYVGGEKHDYQKAISFLQKALVLQPGDYDATSLLGTAYGSSGDHRNAILYFEKALTINPNHAITYVNLGYAQLNMGLEEDAQISFSKAVQIDPKALDRIQNQN